MIENDSEYYKIAMDIHHNILSTLSPYFKSLDEKSLEVLMPMVAAGVVALIVNSLTINKERTDKILLLDRIKTSAKRIIKEHTRKNKLALNNL